MPENDYILTKEKEKELITVIGKMEADNVPENEIRGFVSSYKEEYGVKKKPISEPSVAGVEALELEAPSIKEPELISKLPPLKEGEIPTVEIPITPITRKVPEIKIPIPEIPEVELPKIDKSEQWTSSEFEQASKQIKKELLPDFYEEPQVGVPPAEKKPEKTEAYYERQRKNKLMKLDIQEEYLTNKKNEAIKKMEAREDIPITGWQPEINKINQQIAKVSDEKKLIGEPPKETFDKLTQNKILSDSRDVIEGYLGHLETNYKDEYKDIAGKLDRGHLSEYEQFNAIINPAFISEMNKINNDIDILTDRGWVDITKKTNELYSQLVPLTELLNIKNENPTPENISNYNAEYEKQQLVLEEYNTLSAENKKEIGIVNETFNKYSSLLNKYNQTIAKIGDTVEMPETEWGRGTLRALQEAVVSLYTDFENLGKTVADISGIGDILAHYEVFEKDWRETHKGMFGQMAGVLERGVEDLPTLPDNALGLTLKGFIEFLPLMVEMQIAPELRLLKLPKAVGGVVVKIPKLGVLEGSKGFFNTYASSIGQGTNQLQTIGRSFVNLGLGMESGIIMHGVGIGSAEVGKFASKIVKGSIIPTTATAIAGGGGFGIYDAFNQYVATGEIDWKQVQGSIGTGIAITVPGIMKAIYTDAYSQARSVYYSSSNELIKFANNVKESPLELSKKITELNKEILKEADVKKQESLIKQRNTLTNLNFLKLASEDVASNPEKHIEEIKKDTKLRPEEKKYFLEKVEQTKKDVEPPKKTETQELISDEAVTKPIISNVPKERMNEFIEVLDKAGVKHTIEENNIIGKDVSDVIAGQSALFGEVYDFKHRLTAPLKTPEIIEGTLERFETKVRKELGKLKIGDKYETENDTYTKIDDNYYLKRTILTKEQLFEGVEIKEEIPIEQVITDIPKKSPTFEDFIDRFKKTELSETVEGEDVKTPYFKLGQMEAFVKFKEIKIVEERETQTFEVKIKINGKDIIEPITVSGKANAEKTLMTELKKIYSKGKLEEVKEITEGIYETDKYLIVKEEGKYILYDNKGNKLVSKTTKQNLLIEYTEKIKSEIELAELYLSEKPPPDNPLNKAIDNKFAELTGKKDAIMNLETAERLVKVEPEVTIPPKIEVEVKKVEPEVKEIPVKEEVKPEVKTKFEKAVTEVEKEIEKIHDKWYPKQVWADRTFRDAKLAIGKVAKKHDIPYEQLAKETLWLPEKPKPEEYKVMTEKEQKQYWTKEVPRIEKRIQIPPEKPAEKIIEKPTIPEEISHLEWIKGVKRYSARNLDEKFWDWYRSVGKEEAKEKGVAVSKDWKGNWYAYTTKDITKPTKEVKTLVEEYEDIKTQMIIEEVTIDIKRQVKKRQDILNKFISDKSAELKKLMGVKMVAITRKVSKIGTSKEKLIEATDYIEKVLTDKKFRDEIIERDNIISKIKEATSDKKLKEKNSYYPKLKTNLTAPGNWVGTEKLMAINRLIRDLDKGNITQLDIQKEIDKINEKVVKENRDFTDEEVNKLETLNLVSFEDVSSEILNEKLNDIKYIYDNLKSRAEVSKKIYEKDIDRSKKKYFDGSVPEFKKQPHETREQFRKRKKEGKVSKIRAVGIEAENLKYTNKLGFLYDWSWDASAFALFSRLSAFRTDGSSLMNSFLIHNTLRGRIRPSEEKLLKDTRELNEFKVNALKGIYDKKTPDGITLEMLKYSKKKYNVDLEYTEIITDKEGRKTKTTKIETYNQYELGQLWMWFQDNSLLSTLQSPAQINNRTSILRGNGFGENTLKIIESKLEPTVKKHAEWMLDVLYPEYYNKFNPIVRDIRGFGLEQIPKFSHVARTGYEQIASKGLDILDSQSRQSILGSGTLFNRKSSQAPLKKVSMLDVAEKYEREMIEYTNYSKLSKYLKGLFQNPESKWMMKQYYSKTYQEDINSLLNNYNGTSKITGWEWMDFINSTITPGILAVKIAIPLKQAYSTIMWLGVMKNPLNIIKTPFTRVFDRKTMKELTGENGLQIVKNRGYEGLGMDVDFVKKGFFKNFYVKKFIKVETSAIKYMDTFSIKNSTEYYKERRKFYINEKKLPYDKAVIEAIRDTDFFANMSQQSWLPSEMSRFRRHPAGRGASLFTSGARQLGILQFAAIREIAKGRNIGNNLKMIAACTAVQQLYELSANYWEWDDREQSLGLLFGGTRGVAIMNKFFNTIENLMTAKEYFFSEDLFVAYDNAIRGMVAGYLWYKEASKYGSDETKIKKLQETVFKTLGHQVSMGVGGFIKTYNDIATVIRGETDKPILTLAGMAKNYYSHGETLLFDSNISVKDNEYRDKNKYYERMANYYKKESVKFEKAAIIYDYNIKIYGDENKAISMLSGSDKDKFIDARETYMLSADKFTKDKYGNYYPYDRDKVEKNYEVYKLEHELDRKVFKGIKEIHKAQTNDIKAKVIISVFNKVGEGEFETFIKNLSNLKLINENIINKVDTMDRGWDNLGIKNKISEIKKGK